VSKLSEASLLIFSTISASYITAIEIFSDTQKGDKLLATVALLNQHFYFDADTNGIETETTYIKKAKLSN
jgi:hypothetical protein